MYDLRLPLDWMELLTLREFDALQERYQFATWREDGMHARTARALGGQSLSDLMFTAAPKFLDTPEKSFDDLAGILGTMPGVKTEDE